MTRTPAPVSVRHRGLCWEAKCRRCPWNAAGGSHAWTLAAAVRHTSTSTDPTRQGGPR